MNYNDTEYFYVFNIFSDVTYLLDTSGIIVGEYTYDSYGNITNYNSLSTLEKANPYRYRGYRYDDESGYYYLQSRYYNPGTGRFINIDGILTSSKNVLGNNMYTYTENNPVMRTDSSGYCFASQMFKTDGISLCTLKSAGGAAALVVLAIGAVIDIATDTDRTGNDIAFLLKTSSSQSVISAIKSSLY